MVVEVVLWYALSTDIGIETCEACYSTWFTGTCVEIIVFIGGKTLWTGDDDEEGEEEGIWWHVFKYRGRNLNL